MKKNIEKKGFTIIELLAVIVVLAIIALIATPTILGVIERARKGSAVSSAYGYIDAIEMKTSTAELDGIVYEDKEEYAYDEIEVSLKGKIPTAGTYELENSKVKNAVFCINGYTVTYSNNVAQAGEKCNPDDLKYKGSVKLSSSNGTYTYPEVKTVEVIENISGGNLSCSSSDEEVATCSIEGTTLTVSSGTKEGTATITVKSEGNSKYKEAQAVYVASTAKGILSYTANDYEGTYDGEAHGISVLIDNAIVRYGIEEENYDLEENPTYIDVGEYITYFEITKAGYKTIKGSKKVIITKADGKVTLESESGNIPYNDTLEVEIIENKSNGILDVTTSNSLVAEGTILDNKLVVNGKSLGNATLTVISSETNNYKEANVDYKATVVKANNKLELSSSFGTTTYPNEITFTVTKNVSGGDLSCESEDTAVATCSISGNTVTVKPGTTKGTTTITIKSKETTNYNAGQVAYVITTEQALVSYTAEDYSGVYDGESHSITVTSSGATITYATSENGTYTSEKPTYVNVGEYITYFKVEKEGYVINSGSRTVTITKAEGSVTAPTAKTLTYNENEQALINRGSSTTGTIVYRLDNGEYSENIPTAIEPGEYTVYYKVIGDQNHKDVEEDRINVTIAKATISYTSADYTGTYDGDAHSIELESVGGTIVYGTSKGNYTLSEKPTYVDAGEYIVYYKITRHGYIDVEGSNKVTINRANNTLKLSANTGTVTYPNSGTFTVTTNTSGGALSCASSNEAAATCSISGNIVTVTPGTTEADSVTLKIKSEETTNYNAAQAAYVVTSKNGLLSVSAEDKTVTYDGNEYGITVTSSGSTIKYGTTSGSYTLTSSPTYTDAGTYTIYYQVTKTGYKTVTSSKTLTINQAENPISVVGKTNLTYNGSAQALATVSNAQGNVCYSTSSAPTSCTSAGSISTKTDAGSYTVYYYVAGTKNYKAKSGSVTATIAKKDDSISVTAKTVTYNGSGQTATFKATSGLTPSVTYYSNSTCTTKVSGNPTNAGTYYAKATTAGNTNYNAGSLECTKAVTINKANNTLTLSANTGTVTYPTAGTFTVTENTSGGTLSCASSNEAAATCSISGTTVTVTPGTTEADSVTLTIKSAETANYNAGQAAYVVTSKNGLLSVTAEDKTVTYDGKNYGITVTSSGATIKYKDGNGSYTLTTSPTYTDAGTYTIYYQVTKTGYKTVTSSKTLTINQAENPISVVGKTNLTYNGSAQALATVSNAEGNVCYSTSSKPTSCTSAGTISTGTNAGSYTVYYYVAGNTNYKSKSGSVSVTIAKKADTISLTAKTYTYNGSGKTATISATSGLTPSVTYYSNSTCTTKVSGNPTNAGTYYSKATTVGNNNWNSASLSCTKAVTIGKANNTLTLSANTATYIYPTSGTFTVTKNTSGGTLSCTTSNSNVATCSISGTTVTVTPGTTAGTANITVTSESTTNYNSATVTHVATTASGTLSVTANGYEGEQDGEAHGITVTASGATIKYGTSSGTYNLDASPTYTNVGTYTVYYQVSKEGYKTVTGSKQVIITAETITAPVRSSTTSNSSSITAVYSSGTATSGITSTNCYRTNSSGNVLSNGTLSGNNCVFSSLSSNTTYYYKKCITSKAGNTSCSSVSNILTAGKVTNYDYTGGEQTYTTPCQGSFKLETWGAQGGSVTSSASGESYIGGYGGYSIGSIQLNNNTLIYINVGGQGILNSNSNSTLGGFNGGAVGIYNGGSGGGATHIATTSGILSSLSSDRSVIIMVAGGGGGGAFTNLLNYSNGGSGGGHIGTDSNTNIALDTYDCYRWATGGTQTDGGNTYHYVKNIASATTRDGRKCANFIDQPKLYLASFGTGAKSDLTFSSYGAGGGGGGFYGGGASSLAGAGGGSGYIGNTLLTSKVMYCYNCTESSDTQTKTISTTNVSSTATANYAKQGNGYARITVLSCNN